MTDFFETVTKADKPAMPTPDLSLLEHNALFQKFKSEAEAPAEVGTPTCNANVLCLDIGTQMGWAMGLRDGKNWSGSESFAARKHDGAGQRWLKFIAFLSEKQRQAGELQAVYYESVMAHGTKGQPNVVASHVYGGFLAHLEAWADRNRVRLVPVSVGTIKKHWTGNGRADKAAMIAEARRRGIKVIDDNHCDARALLDFAQQQEA